jgi:hypothetical protein
LITEEPRHTIRHLGRNENWVWCIVWKEGIV